MSYSNDQREKNRVTVVSVLAAAALTLLKLVIGVLTGSLGLLSDAAHSGLDLVSTVITFFSVRIAGRPADEDHPYGHGRVENLSASVQGLLLIVTAGAIIYGAIRRIFFETVAIESSGWAFGVMLASIAVDYWRSRMLLRAARRYHSRALEADALNFRADMLSSAAVIVGLALAAYAEASHTLPFLVKADAVAALFVAGLIIVVSGRMVVQAYNVLLDRAPTTLRDRMTRAAATVPGVVQSQPVRLRESGNRLFADITVRVPRTTSLAEAHTITERVEESIRRIEPRTETVVHVEPAVSSAETAADRIRAIAQLAGANTHHEQVYRVGDHLEASLHVEVEPGLTIAEAHESAMRLREALVADNPRLRQVTVHIEVEEPDLSRRRDVSADHLHTVGAIRAAAVETGLVRDCPEVRVYAGDGPGLDAALWCEFDPSLRMGEVHHRTERLEQELRRRFPKLERVIIEAAPANP